MNKLRKPKERSEIRNTYNTRLFESVFQDVTFFTSITVVPNAMQKHLM